MGTHIFGSMWMFCLYSLLGAIPKFVSVQPTLLFWSNAIQLSALPLLMVGGIVLSKDAERQRKEDHATLVEMHNEMLELLGKKKDEGTTLRPYPISSTDVAQ